ncbi:MAG: hypothetical protein Q7S11_03590 [bacterium]|nr:hypothetical protein [bacterium]
MKYLYFIAVLVVLSVLSYYFFETDGSQIKQPSFEHQFKRTLQGKDLPVLFGKAYIPSVKSWSSYVNKMFQFSIEIPADMEIRHSVNVWEHAGKEYDSYSISFTDTTPKERIFFISIDETPLTSVEKYLVQDGGYSGLIQEKKNIFGIEAIITTSPQDLVHPQPEILRERHMLFIQNGFFFDIITMNMPLDDVERIWESIQFFDVKVR